MPEVEIERVDDEKSFLKLRRSWNELADKMDIGSVFLRHEWFDAAWQWRKTDSRLSILCIRRGRELIGVCPLISSRSRYGPFSIRISQCLAVPDTQECAILADSNDFSRVLEAVFSYLYSSRVNCDLIRFEKIGAVSRLYHTLLPELKRWVPRYRLQSGSTNLGIGIEGDWQTYYSRRSRRLKKGNNLIVNRLKRDDKIVEIKCYESDEGMQKVEHVLEEIVSLSAKCWKSQTGLTLDNDGPHQFIVRLTEHAVKNSWLLVWVLYIDGSPAAMEYQLEYRGTVYGLRADYDEQWKQYSPGTLLNWRIIENFFDRGVTYYSLGPGSNDYKLRWADRESELVTLDVFNRSFKGYVVYIIEVICRPFAAKLKRRFSGLRQSKK